MGKKIQAEMDAQRKLFVEGAVARSVPEAKASEIFDQVNKFAGYGFNKSHAAAYALVSYQTAYLKANYPVEFLAASMTYDMHNTDKLNVFRQISTARRSSCCRRHKQVGPRFLGRKHDGRGWPCAMRWPP